MNRWWHLPLAGLLLVIVSASFAFYLRGLSPVDTFALSFRVTRQQAVVTVLRAAGEVGLPAAVVDVQKHLRGLPDEPGPLWAVVIDVFHTQALDDGPWERRGCLVDGRTAEIRACHGGSLDWIPAD